MAAAGRPCGSALGALCHGSGSPETSIVGTYGPRPGSVPPSSLRWTSRGPDFGGRVGLSRLLAAVGAIDCGAHGRHNIVESVSDAIRHPYQIAMGDTLDLFQTLTAPSVTLLLRAMCGS